MTSYGAARGHRSDSCRLFLAACKIVLKTSTRSYCRIHDSLPTTGISSGMPLRRRLQRRIRSNNRADNTYIPGAVIPGYIIIKPDFPECIDDFGFLWFEDEAVVAGSASWVVAGNAADAIIKESK